MPRYKNIELDDQLMPVIRHMNAVEEYREVLQSLQAVWDNLTLLGQLSGVGTDMNSTRQAFGQLTSSLLNELCGETLKKSVVEMTAKTQVAIDILVRNLFERTADIGFLATDDDIRQFVLNMEEKSGNIHHIQELNSHKNMIRVRFCEYVSKYSVYSDIVLLDTTGKVLVRFDDSVTVDRSQDSLIAEALTTSAAYIETYRQHDLLPGPATLGYSYRVLNSHGEAIGVLFLCFRLENEMERIFSNLTTAEDWSVITLIDHGGKVVASSDVFHIPVGAQMEPVLDEDFRIVRFAGREYLATTRPTNGYQGYMGPGWYGHVMLPVQHAFNKDASEMLRGVSPGIMSAVMDSPSLFGEALRKIPALAESIQTDLNRSVWNGNVRLSSTRQAINATFSKILLWEISNTGSKTKDVFERSIANLHETVVSAILQDSQFIASLAIDIMDRNLYERANDCRWWALTSVFREQLAAGVNSQADAKRLAGILAHINGLYTVYSNLFLFDTQGRVVAVSTPQATEMIGQPIGEEWMRQVLSLNNSQGYAVSPFNATPLYGGGHTYIYGAAVHAPGKNSVVGGVGIVFDAEPQFAAMLRDALPRNENGEVVKNAFAVFVSNTGQVIACSDGRHAVGEQLSLAASYLSLKSGDSSAGVMRIGDHYYAVGARMSSGYREFKSPGDSYRNDVIALVFLPLCEVAEQADTKQETARLMIDSDRTRESETVEIATFHIGSTWFGIRSSGVVEAIKASNITGSQVPGAAFVGYTLYETAPTPIYDIAAMVNTSFNRELGERQIVILRKDEHTKFGILVEGLGEIPEVAIARMRALPAMMGGGISLAEAIINTDNDNKNQLLQVLSVERIAARLASRSSLAFEEMQDELLGDPVELSVSADELLPADTNKGQIIQLRSRVNVNEG